ncbi:ABC transporter ATP-binding protein/permease [Falcatimonas sp. MSJ-15]|uniref:ABC transporter ATP-binding protein n=1 Tax=Falcatimonas sp. MSJ-15 TaxID=2841515 RepID=UPI001C109A6E|nr:ABC transporter ATP-binding protein [Falcatimonas sp. MSJ-15]MBU5470534.1 ABC transporter ATP-binding protein/permease [Falcatimonas sp. MSJ-15]
MKKLLIYLRDYKKECVLAPLFKMLEASFELIVPLVMAVIIDSGIAKSDKGLVVRMCGVLVLLGIIGLITSITAQYFAAKAAVGFATNLRHALFKHLQSLSFTEIDTLGTSTMITRMTSDVNQAQTGVNMVLRLFLRSPFVVFGAMIMAFTIDVKSALIFVVAIILLSIVVFGIMLINIPMLKDVQKKLDTVLNITRENLSGVRVIRAFCKEEEEIERFTRKNEELTAKQQKSGSFSALMNPLTYVIINLAILYLIWTGALQVHAGVLTKGQVVSLYNYMSQILVELIKLANLIITVNKSVACANRIQDVFEIKTSMQYKESLNENMKADNSNAVEFKHVALTYSGAGDESLTDIDFTVRKGETVGIIGGTGSGKSSLVNMIPRFYDATKGEVLIDGINVKDYPREVLMKKVGIVLQKAVLFKGTIESNIRWGKKDATSEDIAKAVEIAQAADVVNAKGGTDAVIAQGGKNLSGGQRQRMTIARALVKKPDILILDDSASALDMATDARLRKSIKELDYNPTVFIVSQRTAAIQNADKIIVLDDGKIVGMGTHDELIKDCEIYSEIYYSQYRKGGENNGR